MPERRHQQLQPSQLLLVLLLVRDSKPVERVDEEGDENGGGDGAGQVNAGHDVDLADVGGEVAVGHVKLLLDLLSGVDKTTKRGCDQGLVSDGVRNWGLPGKIVKSWNLSKRRKRDKIEHCLCQRISNLRTEAAATSPHLLVGQLDVGVGAGGEHGGADDVAQDRVALEEEEEDAEELDNDCLGVRSFQLGKPGN